MVALYYYSKCSIGSLPVYLFDFKQPKNWLNIVGNARRAQASILREKLSTSYLEQYLWECFKIPLNLATIPTLMMNTQASISCLLTVLYQLVSFVINLKAMKGIQS